MSKEGLVEQTVHGVDVSIPKIPSKTERKPFFPSLGKGAHYLTPPVVDNSTVKVPIFPIPQE